MMYWQNIWKLVHQMFPPLKYKTSISINQCQAQCKMFSTSFIIVGVWIWIPFCSIYIDLERYISTYSKNFTEQSIHTVSFDWFMSSLEWILKLEFCLLELLIFYQKLLWNIRSRLNSSTFWVFEPVFKYVQSKSSFFVHKASILINHI